MPCSFRRVNRADFDSVRPAGAEPDLFFFLLRCAESIDINRISGAHPTQVRIRDDLKPSNVWALCLEEFLKAIRLDSISVTRYRTWKGVDHRNPKISEPAFFAVNAKHRAQVLAHNFFDSYSIFARSRTPNHKSFRTQERNIGKS
jgi:hypothetical protein